MTDRSHTGFIAVALAATAWSLGSIGAGALLLRGVDPAELAQSRVVLTAIGFAGASLMVRPVRTGAAVSRIHLLGFGLAIALVMVLILLAIGRLGVAVGTVLHYLAPLLVVLWGVVVGRKRPSNVVLGGAMASVIGVVLVSGALTGGTAGMDLLGIVFGVASATCFATYTVMAEKAIGAYGPVHALLRGFGVATVGWLLFQIVHGWPADLFDPENIWLVLFVGVIGTCLPFLLFLWGIQRVRAERAAIAATLEPVISGAVAWMVLGQALTPLQIIGATVILAAVVSLQVVGAKQAAEVAADVGQSTSPRYQRP